MIGRFGSSIRSAAVVVLALSSGGCATAARLVALGLAGVDDAAPPPSSSVSAPATPGVSASSRASASPSRASESPSRAPAPTSGYEVMPNDRWRLAVGRPTPGLPGTWTPDACGYTPMGVGEVFSILGGTPETPLATLGIFRLYLHGSTYPDWRRPATARSSSGRPMSPLMEGTRCRPGFSLGIGKGSSISGGPVSVLW